MVGKFYFLLLLIPATFDLNLDAKQIAFTISNQTPWMIIFSLGSPGPLHLASDHEMESTMDDSVFSNPDQSKMIFGDESVRITYSIALQDDIIYFHAPSKAMPSYCIKNYSQKNRFTISLYKQFLALDPKDPYIVEIDDSQVINPGYIHENTPFVFTETYLVIHFCTVALLLGILAVKEVMTFQ